MPYRIGLGGPGATFVFADLRHADLHGVQERTADFTDADMEHVQRTNPQRARAELFRAQLLANKS